MFSNQFTLSSAFTWHSVVYFWIQGPPCNLSFGLISPRLCIPGSQPLSLHSGLSALVFTFRALSPCLYILGSQPLSLCLRLKALVVMPYRTSMSSVFYLPQDDAACYAFWTQGPLLCFPQDDAACYALWDFNVLYLLLFIGRRCLLCFIDLQ